MKGKKPLHLRYPLDYTDFRAKYSHPLKTTAYKERRLNEAHFHLKRTDPTFSRAWSRLLDALRTEKISKKQADRKFAHLISEAIQRRKKQLI